MTLISSPKSPDVILVKLLIAQYHRPTSDRSIYLNHFIRRTSKQPRHKPASFSSTVPFFSSFTKETTAGILPNSLMFFLASCTEFWTNLFCCGESIGESFSALHCHDMSSNDQQYSCMPALLAVLLRLNTHRRD
jgi:hypothetical protein